MKHRSMTIAGACAAAALALALSACSSSSSSSSGPASGPASSSPASSSSAAASSPAASSASAGTTATSYATAQLAKYTATPAFTAPGSPLNVASLKGKTIYSIPIDTTTPFLNAVENAQKLVATSVGLKYVTFPSDGSITSYQQGIRQAIGAKAAAIFLDGPLPGTIAPQVKAAEAAGIPVIPEHETDASQPAQAGVTYEAFAQFDLAAHLFTDAAIVNLKGKPVHALVIESSETGPAAGMVAAIKSELSEHAPAGSDATVINVAVPQWSTQIQSQVQTALLRGTAINAVLPIYDSMSEYAAPGIKQAAAPRNIGIYTFNGTPSILSLLAAGNTVRVDMAEDPQWIAYVALDTAFRAILKKPAIAGETGPLRLIDASNVAQTGNPPVLGKGFGDAYVAGMRKLWGLG